MDAVKKAWQIRTCVPFPEMDRLKTLRIRALKRLEEGAQGSNVKIIRDARKGKEAEEKKGDRESDISGRSCIFHVDSLEKVWRPLLSLMKNTLGRRLLLLKYLADLPSRSLQLPVVAQFADSKVCRDTGLIPNFEFFKLLPYYITSTSNKFYLDDRA
tara:strand:+ start:1649 stop:2119 length:471 start_codon:yes stop_codon:yes gene_type:complete